MNKSLHYHGLIQAYSCTNRILNEVKSFGNIVCFRDLQEATDKALTLFSDENAKSAVFLRSLEEYLKGYTDDKGKFYKGYEELLSDLNTQFSLENFADSTLATKSQKDFLALFGAVLKLQNVLECFDDFKDSLSERDRQDYQSYYIQIYENLKSKDAVQKESVLDDVKFELDLLKQVEVSIDYILKLIEDLKESKDKDKNKELRIKYIKNYRRGFKFTQ